MLEAAKIAQLAIARPKAFVYETRGGYRLVWRLEEPYAIASEADAASWRARYFAACDELAQYGILADRSCADWQRLYRLPHATREKGGLPESLATLGDPHAIGTFDLPEAAPTSERGSYILSRPAGPAIAHAEEQDRGVLFALLNARGDVLRPLRPGIWVVRCPRERLHTTGSTGDTSTLLYEARWAAGPGAIHCQHEHCRNVRTARQWKREIAQLPGDGLSTPALRAGRELSNSSESNRP